ncbi:MAG: hypothetical protein QNJ13_09305 [Paracoccaceae bacterium]|nr:hypothetical protein [Paracoccaceae bacterium]
MATVTLVICLAALLSSATIVEARGVRPTVCNNTDDVVLAAMIDSDLRSPRALSTRVFTEDGWWHVDSGDCRRLPELAAGWRAFAFAGLQKGLIRPFIYTPSETRPGSTPPRFDSVCANSLGRSFTRRDVLESDVGKTCAVGADVVVPVSFKIEVGVFTDVSLTINIDGTPDFIDLPMSPRAQAALETASSLLVFEEIDGCTLAAAPSLAAANFTADQVTFDAGRLYALYKTAVTARLSSGELAHTRKYECRNLRQAMIREWDMAILSDDGRYYEIFLYEGFNGVEEVDDLRRFTIPESDAIYNPGIRLLGITETERPAPIVDAFHGLDVLTAHDPTRVTPIVGVGLPAWALLSYADAVLSREPQLQSCIDDVYLANRGYRRVNYTGCLDNASGARLLEILAEADDTFGFDRKEDYVPPPIEVENVDIAAWEGYIDACIPVLTGQYGRSTEGAMFECTCFAAAADLSVEKAYLNYQYGEVFNGAFDDIPAEQRERYSSLQLTCRDRSMRTNPEFDSVVTTLTAPRIAAFLEPTEEIVLAEYLGLTANLNGNGPLKIISIAPGSPLAHLKVGDIIMDVQFNEVRNLTQFHEELEAARATGRSSVILSMRSSRGYYSQEFNF